MDTNVSVEMVTPEIASRWLSENLYEHQRTVRPWHVKFLADEMKRGAFKQDTAIEFSRSNGHELLTDGQHRLNAVIASSTPQRFVIIRRLIASEDEIALDYTRTDKGQRRTTADDYRVLLLEEELGLTATQLNKFGSAVALINSGFMNVTQQKLHTADRLRMMREYNDAYGAFLEVSAGCARDIKVRVERAASLGVALVTFRFSVSVYGDKVENFWRGAIFDDGLRIGDARKSANRHMLDTGMTGRAMGTARKTASAAYSSRYLANCFNSFVTGKELRYSKVFDTAKPMNILGSPFK